MINTREEAKQLFEDKCEEYREQGKASFPLETLEINGKFVKYIDSDTDSAWIGFCMGLSKYDQMLKNK